MAKEVWMVKRATWSKFGEREFRDARNKEYLYSSSVV